MDMWKKQRPRISLRPSSFLWSKTTSYNHWRILISQQPIQCRTFPSLLLKDGLYFYKISAKTSRRTFFRACVFTIFLPHIWNGFIFFCGFYNVFLVPCIVLVSEMLSFTMVTKFNYFSIWKLHRFVLYEVVSKASRGSLLQQWFIRFLVFFQSNVFRKRVSFECSECIP